VTGIYDHPWAYELACDFRDVPHEVDSVLGWCARHRPPVRSVLELAAGPAEHAREFARRGISATALDLSPAMCDYAADQAERAGVRLDVVRADMTDFELGRRFDLIVTMLDSTSHLMTLDALVAHLDRTAAHLAADGLYVLEMSHPADRLTANPTVSTGWEVERDGVHATVRWGEADDRLDPITQTADDHVTIAVTTGGETQVITDVVPYRFWTATELTAAIRLSGALEVVERHGDFAEDVPVDSPEAWRMITMFRRFPGAGCGAQGAGAHSGMG
jgi:SAM-dependent methyltransferase